MRVCAQTLDNSLLAPPELLKTKQTMFAGIVNLSFTMKFDQKVARPPTCGPIMRASGGREI